MRWLTVLIAMMMSGPAWAGDGDRWALASALLGQLDTLFGEYFVGPLAAVLFFDLAFWDNGAEGELKLPFVVVWLVLGAIYFTLRMNFINLRLFIALIELAASVSYYFGCFFRTT